MIAELQPYAICFGIYPSLTYSFNRASLSVEVNLRRVSLVRGNDGDADYGLIVRQDTAVLRDAHRCLYVVTFTKR